MPTYPRGPRLLKGAIITVADGSSIDQVIAFQYNPSSVRRSLKPQYVDSKQGPSLGVRFRGGPVETISLSVQIDAIDQLENGDTGAAENGIHPQLAALELLASPSTAQIQTILGKLNQGAIEILPSLAPLTVFVFGTNRVVPVRLDDVTVEEETHDAALNPIRAQVSLSMSVLSYSDLDQSLPGFQIYMNYHSSRESLASSAYGEVTAVTGDSAAGDSLSYLESL